MNRKSLFNEYEAYTPKGGELSDEILKSLNPIIRKWADKGYSVRDIESIAIDSITMTSAFERLKRSVELRKKERGQSGGIRHT